MGQARPDGLDPRSVVFDDRHVLDLVSVRVGLLEFGEAVEGKQGAFGEGLRRHPDVQMSLSGPVQDRRDVGCPEVSRPAYRRPGCLPGAFGRERISRTKTDHDHSRCRNLSFHGVDNREFVWLALDVTGRDQSPDCPAQCGVDGACCPGWFGGLGEEVDDDGVCRRRGEVAFED